LPGKVQSCIIHALAPKMRKLKTITSMLLVALLAFLLASSIFYAPNHAQATNTLPIRAFLSAMSFLAVIVPCLIVLYAMLLLYRIALRRDPTTKLLQCAGLFAIGVPLLPLVNYRRSITFPLVILGLALISVSRKQIKNTV